MTTEAEIRSWIGGYPRNWDQLCQALMWQLANRFGSVVSTPPSAIDAFNTENRAGRIRSGEAPPGAFLYWDIGTFGHVGFMMNGGRVFMATTHLVEEWTNRAAGWNTESGYRGVTGARYLGWSMQNGGNSVPFTAEGSSTGGGGTPVPINEEDEAMSFINITGKAGERRGGYYAVFALGGGSYTAIFIGQGGPKDLQAVSDDGQIAQLQSRISGLA